MKPTKEAEGAASSTVKAAAGSVVQIDEGRIQAHLDEVVRSTVEETPTNACRLRLSRWKERADAGGSKTAACGSYEMGTKRYLQMNRLVEVRAIA
jgi:hypothetical protein